YDTIYALQDIEDDALAGIKSSARRLGGGLRGGVALFYALTVACLAGAFALVGAGSWAWAALAATAAQLVWQVAALRSDDAARSLRLFRSNALAGLIMFLACFVAAAA
ncbi:MAG: UbiA family prenyltransferase, partial [Sphingomonadaceae bacterium]|nr:UbiA family prenyltransferase [Sphingomonadaceae bacterium]